MKADAVRFAVRFALEADKHFASVASTAHRADAIADDALKLMRLARSVSLAIESERHDICDRDGAVIHKVAEAYGFKAAFDYDDWMRVKLRLPSGSELVVPCGAKKEARHA